MGNQNSQSIVYGEAVENDMQVCWQKVKSQATFPLREGQSTAAVGHKMYIFGGVLQELEDEPTESNDMYCFDTESKTWSKVEVKGQVPRPRSAASLVGIGNNLYLFGGLSRETGWLDDFHVFNTEKQTWNVLETEGKHPSPRDKLQAVAMDTRIYFFGGFGPKETGHADEDWEDMDDDDEDDDDEDEPDEMQNQEGAEFTWFNDLYVFDTASKKWSQPVQMNLGVPTPRAAHGMCCIGRELVIFGGKDMEGRTNDLHMFNVDTRKWNTELKCKGRQPEPRSFHTATSVGNRLVVMGGRGPDNQHFADFHVYNTETSEWLQPKVSGDLPEARGQHSAATVGEYLVLYGGSGKFEAEIMQCTQHFGDTYMAKIEDILKGGSKPKVNGINRHSQPQAEAGTS